MTGNGIGADKCVNTKNDGNTSGRVGKWSGRWDSNPRRLAWEASTLPLSYARSRQRGHHLIYYRAAGIAKPAGQTPTPRFVGRPYGFHVRRPSTAPTPRGWPVPFCPRHKRERPAAAPVPPSGARRPAPGAGPGVHPSRAGVEGVAYLVEQSLTLFDDADRPLEPVALP